MQAVTEIKDYLEVRRRNSSQDVIHHIPLATMRGGFLKAADIQAVLDSREAMRQLLSEIAANAAQGEVASDDPALIQRAQALLHEE
ncbi:hypothetical protein [Thalassospira xiamenensis]|uniref:Uncharacterized protein n=1 Tax=Thalassospira xiamenensis TaxID=220697 RepID=A0A285TYA3_9PROT|nr:hypothetical protein [Thalassospira xiamenensis]SOC30328.1 hypothetical protein SAMN05428964_1096 [Thalassospira xiamenensis]SOC30979.1 hypothetical protein SAMN05428964_11143 [Thalassospira xiamenensis]